MMFVTPVFMLNLTLMGGLWPFGGGDDVVDTGNTIKSLEQKELQLKATPEVVDGATLAREQYREFLKLTFF